MSNKIEKRITLSTGYEYPKLVFEDIEKLDKEFRTKFKKSANTQLVYSSYGNAKLGGEKYELVAWYETGDEKEIEWFTNALKVGHNL